MITNEEKEESERELKSLFRFIFCCQT